MNKLVSVLAVGVLCFIMSGGSIFASAAEIDVKEDLKNMARVFEAEHANMFWGTDFKPGDGYRASMSSNGKIYVLDPPEYVKGDNRITNLVQAAGKIDVVNSWGEIDKVDSEISKSPLYAGKNVLDNSKGSTDQDLLTPEFSRKFTEAISTKTTVGVKVGEKITAKVVVPFFSASSDTSIEVDTSHEMGSSKSIEVVYKSPSQKIKVPAGKRYQVSAYLDNASVTGSMSLHTEVSGLGWFETNYNPGGGGARLGRIADNCKFYGWGNFNNYEPKEENVIVNGGKAKFESSYGTNFILKIEDISDGTKNPHIIREIKVPLKK